MSNQDVTKELKDAIQQISKDSLTELEKVNKMQQDLQTQLSDVLTHLSELNDKLHSLKDKS